MEPRMEHILHKALPRITQTISGPLYTVIFGHTSTIAIRYCPENMQNMYTMAILNYVDQAPSVRDLSRGLPASLPFPFNPPSFFLSFFVACNAGCWSLLSCSLSGGPRGAREREALYQTGEVRERERERETVCVLIGQR